MHTAQQSPEVGLEYFPLSPTERKNRDGSSKVNSSNGSSGGGGGDGYNSHGSGGSINSDGVVAVFIILNPTII